MLEEARECPDIRLFPKTLEDVKKIVCEEYAELYHKWATAWYFHNYNVVTFNKMWFISEDNAINLLLHEVDHWAQTMFLEIEEQAEPLNMYGAIQKAGRTPFVEWINIYRSLENFPGAYCFDEWKLKYPRGINHFAGLYAYF